MIAIVDYGVGNLFSLNSSLVAIGADAVVTADPQVLREADKIILPGVGAFEDAAKKLFDSGLAAVLIEEAKAGKPLLGSVWVCSSFLRRATSTEPTGGLD